MEQNNYELYHYGVKGMKWGVRRYINADGSLTDEGRRRYRDADPKAVKRHSSTKDQLQSLSGRQRRATKKYLKDYDKSYRKDAKKQYKNLGRNRGLKKLEVSSDGTVRNRKTGERIDVDSYVKAMKYKNIYSKEVKERAKLGAAYFFLYLIH